MSLVANAEVGQPSPETPVPNEELTRVETPVDRAVRVEILIDETPVPRAEIFVLPLDERIVELASRAQGLPPEAAKLATRYQSGEDGGLDLRLPRQEVLIAARGEGTGPMSGIVEEDYEGTFQILLIEESTLSGKVLFEDGQPAAGAKLVGRRNVHLENTMRGRTMDPRRLAGMFFESEAASDADGSYAMNGLGQGIHVVVASLPGFAHCTAPMVEVPWYPTHDFVIRSRARISGLVTEKEGGRPIEGVRVEAYIRFNISAEIDQAAYSDPSGAFQLDAVRGGVPRIALRTHREGYATEVLPVEHLLPGETREVKLSLEPSSTLTGSVRSSTGDRILNAWVNVSEQETGASIVDVHTENDGQFECSMLAPGRAYRVEAGRGDFLDRVLLEDVRLPTDPLEIVLPAHGVVAGKVTADGLPVMGGKVRLGMRNDAGSEFLQHWAEIDAADGSYRFEDVPPGGHVLDASVDGYAPVRLDAVRIDPPHTDELSFDLEVTAGAALFGIITDAASGEPVIGATVRLVASDELGYRWAADLKEAVSNGSGIYRFEHVPRGGTVGLLIDHSPHARVAAEIDISQAADTAELDITLPLGATVRCWIEDQDGNRLQDVWGYLIGEDRELPIDSDPLSGLITFQQVEPGSVTVAAVGRSALTAYQSVDFHKPIELRPGEVRDVAFSLAAGGRIRGVIDCPPHRGKRRQFQVDVTQSDVEPPEFRATDIIAGVPYRIFGVAPGKQVVEIHSTDMGPRFTATRKVEVRDGEELTVDFMLGRGSVEGQVTTLSGEPLAGVTMAVRLPDAEEHQRTGDTGMDGNYIVPGLSAGTHEYVAVKDGYGLAEGWFELTEDHGTAHVDLQLEPEAVIRLRLESRAGGELAPVSMSCVRVDSMLINPELRRSGPDSEGYYTYPKARSGNYRIDAIAPGHFPGELVETLAAGETRSVILSLRRLGQLEIRVIDANGLPLAGAFVSVTDLESGRSVSGWISRGFVQASSPDQTTDKNGRLTLSNLPAGKFTLEVPGAVRVVTVPVGPEGAKVLLTQL